MSSETVSISGPYTPDELAGVVRDAGGNLAQAAHRAGIPRATLVSRMRRQGLDHVTRAARAERAAEDVERARKVLGELPPSDRVRALLIPSHARAALLAELAARDDIDEDARAALDETLRSSGRRASARDGLDDAGRLALRGTLGGVSADLVGPPAPQSVPGNFRTDGASPSDWPESGSK
jgi:hypothetical protein